MGMSPYASLYWGYDLGTYDDPDTFEARWPDSMRDTNGDLVWTDALARALGWEKVEFPEPPDELRDLLPPEHYFEPDTARRDRLAENRRRWGVRMSLPAHQAWNASQERLGALVENYPVTMGTYGGEAEPRYCVQVRDSIQYVGDWGSTVITSPLLVDVIWFRQVEEFMTLLGLEHPEGDTMGWHLNCGFGY